MSFHLSLHSMGSAWFRRWGEEETPSPSTSERSAFHRDSTIARKTLLNRTGWHNIKRSAPPQVPTLKVSTREYLFQDKQSCLMLDNGLTGPPPRETARVGKCGLERKGRTPLRETDCAHHSVFPWKKAWVILSFVFQLRLDATSPYANAADK